MLMSFSVFQVIVILSTKCCIIKLSEEGTQYCIVGG